MKILIKESQYKVLLEQSVDNTPNVIYGKIVNAVAGLGTDENGLLEALKLLKSPEQFKQLLSLFKDKKTGYDSFKSMIWGEFELDNNNDFLTLVKILNSKSIVVDWYKGNKMGKYAINKFKIPLQQVPKECSSLYQPLLEKAKNYWIQWLSNPITKKKFLNNWKKVEKNMTSVEVENIFKKYIDSLKRLKLFYYDNKSELDPILKNANAYVVESNPEKIFVNCSAAANNKNPYATLIHEIQHLLYDIKPLNPAVQVADVFVDSNTKLSTINTFFNFEIPYKINQSPELRNVEINSKKVGTTSDSLKSLLDIAKIEEKKNPGYVCRETEKMSNIIAIRNLFNVKPGENITQKMISPYIKGTKKDTNVGWVLYCWALSGFKNLDGMLNKINDLAYQNTNQNNNSNTRAV
jgi:hypothetical protein